MARQSKADESAMKAMAEGVKKLADEPGRPESDSDDEGGLAGDAVDNDRVTNTGFGKYMSPRFPLFASVERRFVHDDYGQRIRPSDFADKSLEAATAATPGDAVSAGAILQAGGGGSGAGGKEAEAEDTAMSNVREELPTKTEIRQTLISLRCQIHYVDFEGCSDGYDRLPFVNSRIARIARTAYKTLLHAYAFHAPLVNLLSLLHINTRLTLSHSLPRPPPHPRPRPSCHQCQPTKTVT